MSKFKGTQGSWKLTNNHEMETDVVTTAHRICECKHYKTQIHKTLLDPTKEEGMYNALLISKAPEMLEMLERLSDTYELLGLSNEVKQLIKEATEL